MVVISNDIGSLLFDGLNLDPDKPCPALDGQPGDVMASLGKIGMLGDVTARFTEYSRRPVPGPEDPGLVGDAAAWALASG
jgi:hypothetical protein